MYCVHIIFLKKVCSIDKTLWLCTA